MEFKNMRPGQGEEVHALVLKAVEASEKGKKGEPGFTPEGKIAFERYVAPVALEQRASLGYVHELAYVSGELAGVMETKGPDRITMLYIHPDYANKGLGSRLVARAASRCLMIAPKIKQMTVYATDDAVDFYERAGFVRNGSRKESGGIYATPYKLLLNVKGKALPSRLHTGSVEFFVFSGTGNSLLIARVMAEILKQEGISVRLRSMDEPFSGAISEETAIGLAFPVACFTTYPSVWRFIASMPEGEGREVFMIGTCGGFSGGMQGPLRKALTRKGYKTIAAKFCVMPGNYNNKTLPRDKNAARVEKALLEARSFAYDLMKGGTEWSGGTPLFSRLLYLLGQTRKPWDVFYKMFPIEVDREKCTRCGRCVNECPAKAIEMEDFPVIDPKTCESCQRCVGFCPVGALHDPRKPAEPYRAMPYEEFKAAFR